MKFKLELFLLLALGVYLLILVYSYVDLKCYERKLNSDKPIFKEKIVNDEIEKIRYSFKIKEMKNCEILLLEISEDIFTLFFMVLLNLLFYFRRTNDTFVEVCRILITFPQYYSFFNDENNRAVLTFLSLLSLLFVPMLFPLMIDLRFYVPAIFVYFFLLFLVRRKLFGSVKYLNRRNVFISSFLLFFPYVYFIKSIIFSVFYSTKTNIPQNLSGKGLEMAQNFYGKEKVYYFLSEQVNMGTFLNFFTKTLLIFGDWSDFTESEILGCVSHEIGHGGTLECILIYLLEYLLTVFLFTLYYEIIKLYAKKIDSRFDHNEAKIFLFYFNLYFFSTIYYLSLNFFSQNMEYLVDLKAVRIAPDGDIISGFFKMYLINDDLFYKPRFYSYFLCDHPSIYHRILNIKCK